MKINSSRPKTHHIAFAVSTLKGIKIELLSAVWFFLFSMKDSIEVSTFHTKWAGNLVSGQFRATLPHTLTKIPPAIHDVELSDERGFIALRFLLPSPIMMQSFGINISEIV